MVEKLKKIIAPLEEEFGPLDLLAVLKMDEIIDKWSLIVSASWTMGTDEAQRETIFDRIYNLVEQNLGPQDASTIARIGLLPKNSHIVQELKSFKPTDKETFEIREMKVNGNIIHEGIILKATT